MSAYFQIILWMALWLPAMQSWAQAAWFGPTSIDELASRPRVSLVFASPDEVSPLSYFGHTFLVFHHEEFPEIDAPLVEFMGQTAELDHWALQALFGSIPGRYQLQRFLYKAREYDFENRDLWIYTLKISEAERQEIVKRLRERLPQVHPYQFTGQNCGAYIEELLPFVDEPQPFYTLPIRTLQNPKVQSRIESARVQLSQRSQGRLSQDKADLLRYQFAREADRSKRQEIFQNLKNLPAPQPQVRTDDPATFSGRRRLGLQFFSGEASHITLSPYAQDFFTPAHEVVPGSVLRILETAVRIDRNAAALDRLEIFHLEAMSASDDWTDGMVRHLEFGWQKQLEIQEQPGWRLRWGNGYAWQATPHLLWGAKFFVDLNLRMKTRTGLLLDAGGILYAEQALTSRTRAFVRFEQSALPQYGNWSEWNVGLSHAPWPGITLEAGASPRDWHFGLMQHF